MQEGRKWKHNSPPFFQHKLLLPKTEEAEENV